MNPRLVSYYKLCGPSVTVTLASVSPKRIGDRVAPKSKMMARYQIHQIYITVPRPAYVGEMLPLREDLRGMKMGYPLCFPVCREFNRWLCPDFAQIIIIIIFDLQFLLEKHAASR